LGQHAEVFIGIVLCICEPFVELPVFCGIEVTLSVGLDDIGVENADELHHLKVTFESMINEITFCKVVVESVDADIHHVQDDANNLGMAVVCCCENSFLDQRMISFEILGGDIPSQLWKNAKMSVGSFDLVPRAASDGDQVRKESASNVHESVPICPPMVHKSYIIAIHDDLADNFGIEVNLS
jgi:hypothetical protein